MAKTPAERSRAYRERKKEKDAGSKAVLIHLSGEQIEMAEEIRTKFFPEMTKSELVKEFTLAGLSEHLFLILQGHELDRMEATNEQRAQYMQYYRRTRREPMTPKEFFNKLGEMRRGRENDDR